MMSRKQQAKGFTLIELVVVIAILAILAAFALPRFAQLSEQAHNSSVQGTSGALSAGVALAKAQWVGNGASTASADRTDLSGFGDETIEVSEEGWPVATGGYTGESDGTVSMTADRCVQVWQALLQSNAPTVSTGTGEDYTASASGSECNYTYTLDGEGNTIEYDASNGDITTTIN